jgi:signal transduction histidine kinase
MKNDSFSKLKFHQRQLIINKDVQWAIIIYSIILGFAVAIGSRILETVSDEQTFVFSDPQHSKILVFSIIFLFFVFILLYGLYLTNRIAGPLYRLKKQMENLLEGKDAEDLQFRKNDFFKEFSGLFNRLAEKQRMLDSRQAKKSE